MPDVRFEKIPEDIAEAMEQVRDAVIIQSHILDALELKKQHLMQVAVSKLDIPEPSKNEKRNVRFDLESKQIIIEDTAQIIT